MAQIKQFRLPDVGEGLTEGEILQWMVAVGDTVVVNQPIVEVETAKAAVELPCPYAGVVTELLYDAGATVDVGAPIISIDTAPGESGAGGTAPGESGAGGTAPGGPAAGTEAERAAVLAAAPAPSAQTLAEVHVAAEDEAIEPGLIGGPAPGGRTSVLVGYGPRTTEATRRPRTSVAAPAAARAPMLATAPDVTDKPVRHGGLEVGRAAEAAATRAGGHGVLAKPLVRRHARQLGVDLAALAGTGAHGSITRADVDAAVEAAAHLDAAAASPANTAGPDMAPGARRADAPVFDGSREQRIPVKGVRKHTAAAMVASAFTAPHVTEWITIDVTPMMELRQRLGAHREWRGVKLSPLVFVAKALLLAAARHPMINSSWDEAAQEIVVKGYVNLGIAAATPRGLIVPNVKDAGRLGLRELAEALSELTETARAGRTTPADMGGGTITISNVGVFGVDTGTPILNPGESAILAFGAIRDLPWVHQGQVVPRQVTTLGLSFDHRVVDGELGSRFLADLASVLADPGMSLTF